MTLQIPRFEIGPELGHGANSVVYRARLDGRPCALKVPRTQGSWTRWVYREAVALARVHHPGLPAVIEVGESDGLPFLAMELIEGETLADRLQKGPLEQEAAIGLALQVLGALDSVHAAGLVHRDVKPRNMILEPGGALRLVDFGFATAIEHAPGGFRAGTPGYAAPEQFHAPARVDARADLYAVGMVLFECLTGQPPTRAGVDGVLADTLARAGVPVAVATIVSGLLAPEPELRYPDARAALADLDRVKLGLESLGPSAYESARSLPPLVGRDDELESLERVFDVARRGRGAVALIGGESGCGKTRLLLAAHAAWRERGAGNAIAVPSRDGDAPLAVLRRILEGLLDLGRKARIPSGATIEDVFRAAAENHLAPLAKLIAPSLDEVLGPSADAATVSASSFAEGSAELLVRLARGAGPLLIAVDDLQWTDSASRDVLVRVAHRVREVPLALVLAGRHDRKGTLAFERFVSLDAQRVESIQPAAFGDPEIETLLRLQLGQHELDPKLVALVATLAGHTPLGVLEVLRAFLDTGALRPCAGSWVLDLERAERVALPEGALALLGRRLDELPPATRVVLLSAAVFGAGFEDELLARVVEIDVRDLGFALSDARRAGLLQSTELGKHRFVHDTVRERLLSSATEEELRDIHQRVAEELDRRAGSSLTELCTTASHYAAGDLARAPTRTYLSARRAADAAVNHFDNETAIRFLELARSAAGLAGVPLDADFHRSLGEAELRLGALEESLAAFEAGLASTTRPVERAAILGRIAWVHQTAAEPDRAWSSLARAFEALGARMPVEGMSSATDTLGSLGRLGLGVLRKRERQGPSAEVALLCELHYQNARLGLECERPLRVLQSTMQGLQLSDGLGPSTEQARARATRGFLQTALGRREAGRRDIAQAQDMAIALSNPAMRAFCVQLGALGACLAGDFDEALQLLAECLGPHAHWLELSEYCINVTSLDVIETVRGRPDRAWPWVERAVDRVQRSHHAVPVFTGYFVHRVRAALASLDRDFDPSGTWLGAQHASAVAKVGTTHAQHRLLSWGPRMRVLLERGELGRPLEDLVASFESEHHNPRFGHPLLAEYYIAVAHARVEQLLAAEDSDRHARLPALRKALADLRASARLPLFKAHRLLIEGWLHWFEGSTSQARSTFEKAEALAIQETCPWVLSGVARARAHMLLQEGKPDAARDQARIAESLAREHGAEPRARTIRRELGLPDPRTIVAVKALAGSSSSSGYARRQLASLLHVARAGVRDLRPEPQAISILDEIMRDVDAERATIWFHPDRGKRTRLIIGRSRDAQTFFGAEGWRHALLRQVHESGAPATSESGLLDSARESYDKLRVLAVPLSLYDQPVGALCLERSASSPPFGKEARELLSMLTHQVPLALEIAALLSDRDRMQTSLQQAQKMEAVGRLAGGVAHDFNNMLTAIITSLHALSLQVDGEGEAGEEIEIITDATQRAVRLTRQLLDFSRHNPIKPGPCVVNDVVTGLEPMLQTLVGRGVTTEVSLAAELGLVRADRGSLEQALVNLAVNARDAMEDSGNLLITTRSEQVTEARGPIAPGHYVVISVTDTGHGISEEVLERIFEPFFTTKEEGVGTGLGLTTVYAFAKNCGGHVDVTSELGKGTTFRIHLPRLDAIADKAPMPLSPASAASRTTTVLVVDDEELVTRSIRKMLERAGHKVLVAHSGAAALELARGNVGRIGVALVDVRMPGMTGPELGDRLAEMAVPFRVLYMSGFAPDHVPVRDGVRSILEKPFSRSELLKRVDQLLSA